VNLIFEHSVNSDNPENSGSDNVGGGGGQNTFVRTMGALESLILPLDPIFDPLPTNGLETHLKSVVAKGVFPDLAGQGLMESFLGGKKCI
jgi:hypothetical protein